MQENMWKHVENSICVSTHKYSQYYGMVILYIIDLHYSNLYSNHTKYYLKTGYEVVSYFGFDLNLLYDQRY